jgi:hypothetical protein
MDSPKLNARVRQLATSLSTPAKQEAESVGPALVVTGCRDCRRIIAMSFPSGVPLDGYGLPLVSAMSRGLFLKQRFLLRCAECEAASLTSQAA